MSKLRTVTVAQEAYLLTASNRLLDALQYAKLGGATAAVDAIRRARKSIAGAIRHAERIPNA